jgi:hypothetical protein
LPLHKTPEGKNMVPQPPGIRGMSINKPGNLGNVGFSKSVITGLAHMGYRFPLPFKSLRIISGGKEGLYVIGAMFTAPYSNKAELHYSVAARVRLARSLLIGFQHAPRIATPAGSQEIGRVDELAQPQMVLTCRRARSQGEVARSAGVPVALFIKNQLAQWSRPNWGFRSSSGW